MQVSEPDRFGSEQFGQNRPLNGFATFLSMPNGVVPPVQAPAEPGQVWNCPAVMPSLPVPDDPPALTSEDPGSAPLR